MAALPGIALPGGVPPTYPRGPGPWDICRAAKEMSHRVVGGVAVGAGRVIGPAVVLEPRAIAGSELGEGASARSLQQLFGRANWKGSGHEHFAGHPAS